jgi:hypothetical protein
MNQSANRNDFRKFFTSTLIIAAILVGLNLTHAQEVLFRQVADKKTDTHVEVTSLFSDPSIGGYHPIRVFISNGQLVNHTIHLNFQSFTSYNGSLSTSSRYSFTIKSGEVVSYDILVPLTAQNGNNYYEQFKVSLSGTMGNNGHNDTIRFGAHHPCVLLSDKLHAPNASALDSEVATRSSSSPHYSGTSGYFSSRFSPTQLPDDWRAYSGFDSILMTSNDWMSVPSGPRNAIISWMRLGGQVIIYSDSASNPNALGLPSDISFGEYLIKNISGDRLDPKPTVDLVYNRKIKTRITAATKDFNTSWPLQKLLNTKDFNSILFILILIIFGIIVGPVNLFVFAKSGRRHRLFITTPIISILTSLLLIVLIILQDGFGGEGKRLVLMEVRPDDNQNAAFIHQEQFSRTGVMTSPSFTIEESALFTPVPLRASRWSRFTDSTSSGNYDIQPTGGKLYASGSWFQSRSEQGQLISAVVPTRGRIELGKQDGEIVSNFDFPIKTLLYLDEKGQWHRVENLTKGKSSKLISIDPTMIQPILNDLNLKFTERNKAFLKKVQDRKGHYIAITEDVPGINAPGINTHPSIDWETTTIITGPIVR